MLRRYMMQTCGGGSDERHFACSYTVEVPNPLHTAELNAAGSHNVADCIHGLPVGACEARGTLVSGALDSTFDAESISIQTGAG